MSVTVSFIVLKKLKCKDSVVCANKISKDFFQVFTLLKCILGLSIVLHCFIKGLHNHQSEVDPVIPRHRHITIVLGKKEMNHENQFRTVEPEASEFNVTS